MTRSIVGAYIPQPLGAMGYPWPSTGPGRLATSREMLGFRKCFGRRQAFVVVVELAVIWKFGSLVQNPKLPELKKNSLLDTGHVNFRFILGTCAGAQERDLRVTRWLWCAGGGVLFHHL